MLLNGLRKLFSFLEIALRITMLEHLEDGFLADSLDSAIGCFRISGKESKVEWVSFLGSLHVVIIIIL